MNIVDVFLKIITGFFVLLITTKILGKTQLNQINAFDFISALVLGELLGNAIYDKNIPIFYVFFTISLWGLLIYCSQIITQKYKKSRSFLEGKPSLIIDRGKINKQELKKNKLDINNLQELLRQENIFSLREVKYALLEASGELSVLKKSGYATPSRRDINLPVKPVDLPLTLINDGEIVADNLKETGHDKKWLIEELQNQNVGSIKEVFYAEWMENEGLFIDTYNNL